MADERIAEGIWYFVAEFIIEAQESRGRDHWAGNYARVSPEKRDAGL